MSNLKVRENRLRRKADRRELRLEKCRRRDVMAFDFGTYRLINPYTGFPVHAAWPHDYGLDLDAVEAYLSE